MGPAVIVRPIFLKKSAKLRKNFCSSKFCGYICTVGTIQQQLDMENTHNIKAEWVKNSSLSEHVSTDRIYTVSDVETLEAFKLLPKNRDVDEAHVRKIVKDLEINEPVEMVIVEINTGYIIDGQHRITATKRYNSKGGNYGLEVKFIDCGGDMDKMVHRVTKINTTASKWKDKNFAKSYREEGNAYDKLFKWAESHELTRVIPKTGKNKGIPTPRIQQAAIFIQGPNYRRNNIKNNLFIADDIDFETADQIHDEVKYMLGITGLGIDRGNWFEAFVIGWHLFSTDYKYRKRIEAIGGMSEYFKYVATNLDTKPSTRNAEWKDRFSYVLRIAENERRAA